MIVTKIKKYFLRRKIYKLSKSNHQPIVPQSLKKIGVLTTKKSNDTYHLDKKVKEIFPRYRSVNTYCFRKKYQTDANSFDYFSEKDFNLFGTINDDSLQSFVNEKFDVLICYFDRPNVFLENLTCQSQANFKVGFSNVNQTLFDLEILGDLTNIDQFNTELKKYLQILGASVV